MRGRALLALGLCALAVAGSWMVPGLVGKGWSAIAPQEQVAPSPDSTTAQVVPPAPSTGSSLANRLTGLVGLAAIIGIGFALSRDRRRISWRVVAWGLGLQVAFAILVLRVPALHLESHATASDRDAAHAELSELGAWLKLDRVEVEREGAAGL